MDGWLAEYDQLISFVNEINADLSERSNILRLGTATPRLNSQIKRKIRQLSVDTQDLEESLMKMSKNPERYRITMEEISRRMDMVKLLKVKKDQLSTAASSSQLSVRDDRENLLQQNNNGSSQSRFNADYQEDAQLRQMDSQDILSMQQHSMKKQDEGIDALSDTLKRTKEISVDIGEEIGVHTKLLGEFEDDVDKTHTRLVRETKRITKVRKRSAYCLSILCVLALVIILVVLLVLPVKCDHIAKADCSWKFW